MTRSGHRRGGALYAVILITAVLFGMSAMLPQLLTAAGAALARDADREEVLRATESGLAIAEARLKRVVGDAVLDGRAWQVGQYELGPSPDSPDYGPKKGASFRVKLLALEPLERTDTPEAEIHRFSYRLRAYGWSRSQKQRRAVAANGLLTVNVELVRGASGLAYRRLGPVTLQAIDDEVPFDLALPPVKAKASAR